jgi:hypothetical protein
MKDEALRQALEALEKLDRVMKRSLDTDKAITAIKQALDQEKALQALHDENERLGLYKDAYGQPKPEPVAWAGVDFDIKTYSPKREWQGLTDVDVSKILDEQNGFYTFEKWFNFAKAIEAKWKERNT